MPFSRLAESALFCANFAVAPAGLMPQGLVYLNFTTSFRRYQLDGGLEPHTTWQPALAVQSAPLTQVTATTAVVGMPHFYAQASH